MDKYSGLRTVAVQVFGATSGEKLGRWEISSETAVWSLKEHVMVLCDDSVIEITLLLGDEVLSSPTTMPFLGASCDTFVLTCIKHDALSALSHGLSTLCTLMDTRLEKRHITEIKAYAKPPDLVMKTLCAVMVLLGQVPAWAQAKTEMCNPGFKEKIMSTDKASISKETLGKLSKYLADSQFTPEIVFHVSMGAGILCQWVRLMAMYADAASEDRAIEYSTIRAELDGLKTLAALFGAVKETLEAAVKLDRKHIDIDLEAFKASKDYEVLEHIVAIQPMLPFVSVDDLTSVHAQGHLAKWTLLTEHVAAMLFEQGSELRFPLELVHGARQMQKSSHANVKIAAEKFLKDLDSNMTKIASDIEPALANLNGDGHVRLMSVLAESMTSYTLVWAKFQNFCKDLDSERNAATIDCVNTDVPHES